ncbi:hypothetical protein N8878_02200 [Psychromonas sp.]|nr:hypothetical protein [Psychromonas sp.]
MPKIFFVILLLSLSGCSLQQHNNNKLANQLRQQPPASILATLKQTTPDDTDIAQYDLNVGYLQLITGDFESAIISLSRAKKEMQLLEAISVSENVAAGTVNETFRRYSGYPTDRVMVHNMLALSYLFNNDIEGARVEMLQADITMKKLADGEQLHGQLAETHLLSAIIYELLDERSNSFISYQFTEKVLNQRNMPLPEGVKLGLLRMSYKMGNDAQYTEYSKKFPQLVKLAQSNKQIFGLYFDGVVSNKIEKSIMVPSYNGEQLIRISMPAYPPLNYRPQKLDINDGQQITSSTVVENIDLLAREDLDKEYPSILILTTTRAVSKYKVVEEATKKDAFAGALLNIATVLSEVADVRSWNMLPANIQFGYFETNVNNVTISTTNKPDSIINLEGAQQFVFLASSLTDTVFHYQQ